MCLLCTLWLPADAPAQLNTGIAIYFACDPSMSCYVHQTCSAETRNQKPEIINQNPETSCRTQCPVAQPVVDISGPAQPTLPNNVRKNISMAYLAVSTALHALTLTASSTHAGQTNITHAGQTSRA